MEGRLLSAVVVSSCIYQEVDQPEALCYVEEWADLAQMEEQIRSRRFGRSWR
jgi:hypothetical protein